MQNMRKTLGIVNIVFSVICIVVVSHTVWGWTKIDEKEEEMLMSYGHDYYLVLTNYLIEPVLLLAVGAIITGVSGWIILKPQGSQ